MEYVDGEDLAASLRRVGRFPKIARSNWRGRFARVSRPPHANGVIHRDLKPANIMIDAAGRARIMDLGLASAEAVEDVRVGTPAYMAPEQLEGREVTVRSDIFALGLVLYELFTGRRVFTAATLADLVEAQAAGRITPPTDFVKALDPAIERAIRAASIAIPRDVLSRCSPSRRRCPVAIRWRRRSRQGETPSPEMVAAAGGDRAALSLRQASPWLALTAVLMYRFLWICTSVGLLSRSPLGKAPPVLADRAQEIRASLGYDEPFADSAYGFAFDTDYLNWADAHGSGKTHWAELGDGRPATIRRHRTSPRARSRH
jgi:serine/threonine-protein kinase